MDWGMAQTLLALVALGGLATVWWEFSRTPQFGVHVRERSLGFAVTGRERFEIRGSVFGSSVVYDLEPLVFGDAVIEERSEAQPRADAASEPITFVISVPSDSESSGYGLTAVVFDRWTSRRLAYKQYLYGDHPAERWILYRLLWLRYAWWRLRRRPKSQFPVGRWIPDSLARYDAGAYPQGTTSDLRATEPHDR